MSDTQKANDEGDLDLVLISALQDRYEFLSKYGVAGAHTEKALFSAIAAVHELIATKHKLAAMTKRAEEAERDAGIASEILEMCKQRGWSLHWTHRGAYLHLEASELIEAVRGKRGTVVGEAADVLLVLMSITEHAGIPWKDVMTQARATLTDLFTRSHYAGEEYIDAARGKNG